MPLYYQQIAHTTFQQPDGPLETADWELLNVGNNYNAQVLSNICYSTVVQYGSWLLWTSGSPWNTGGQYVEATFQTLGGSTSNSAIIAGMTDVDGQIGWASDIQVRAGGNIRFTKNDSMSGNVIGTRHTVAFVPGAKYRVEYYQDTMREYYNGVLLQTVTGLNALYGYDSLQGKPGLVLEVADVIPNASASEFAAGNISDTPFEPTGQYLFTPIYSNSLQGANQNPLDPTNIATGGFAPLQVLNDVGISTAANNFNSAVYIGTPTLSDDQYASIEINTWFQGQSNTAFLGVRTDAPGNVGYFFDVFDNNDGTAFIELAVVGNGGQILYDLYSDPAAPIPTSGESFRLLMIGSTIVLYRGSSILFSGTDTLYSSGLAQVSISPFSNDPAGLTVMNLEFGNVTSVPVVASSPSMFGYGLGF